MCIKDKIEKIKEIELERSFDARLALCRRGECYPIKSFCLHRGCSSPLWKAALVTMGIVIVLASLCCAMKKAKKRQEQEICSCRE